MPFGLLFYSLCPKVCRGWPYILSVLDRRARFSSWEIACETATRTPGRVLYRNSS
jgi:hypothetical protein